MSGFVILFFAGLVVLAALVVLGTKRRGKMGINFSRPACPRCGTQMPLFRKPTSVRQTLWGGWTCPDCGCEIDKWGKEIPKGPV